MTAPALSAVAGTAVRYLVQSSVDLPSDDAWLAPIERARLAQLRIAKRRADWRLGRWTAKQAVAAALDVAPDRVAVIATAGGAPLALLDGLPAPLTISLSHAAGRGLCAVAPAGTAIGCDLEVVAERGPAFAADYCTAAERAWIGADARSVTLAWSAKEAVLKALGEGLREDPRAVEVTLEAGRSGAWAALSAVYRGHCLSGWSRDVDDLVAVVVECAAPAKKKARDQMAAGPDL